MIGAREVSGNHSGGVHGGDVAKEHHGDDEDHKNNTQFPEIHFRNLWIAVVSGMKVRCSMKWVKKIAVQILQRIDGWNEGKVFDEMSERNWTRENLRVQWREDVRWNVWEKLKFREVNSEIMKGKMFDDLLREVEVYL